MTLYGYIAQSWIYYICYFINCRKFLAALAALEIVHDKFAGLNDNIKVTYTSNGKFWICFEIFMFSLYSGMEVIFILSRGKRLSVPIFVLTILLVASVYLLEIYISMLYLLTASHMQLYYERLNSRLEESVRSLIMKADVLEKFGKNGFQFQ